MENLPPEPLPAASASARETSSPPTAEESASPPSVPSALSGVRDGRLALAAAGGYLLFWQVVLHIGSSHILVVLVTTLLSLLLTLYFTVRTARALRSPRALGWNLLCSGLLGLPYVMVQFLYHLHPEWELWGHIQPYWHAYHRPFLLMPGLHELVLMWLAVCIGVLVSYMVREFKMLLPMGIVLACVDLYVVFGGGLVTQANSGHAPGAAAAMQALTLQLPTIQPKTGAAPFPLAIGFADFLFIALFFACFARFDIPSRRTFIALYVVLTLYMLVVALRSIDLPALVPIGVVVIGMNLFRFRYQRAEAFALLYAGLIVLAVAGGFYLFSRQQRSAPPPGKRAISLP